MRINSFLNDEVSPYIGDANASSFGIAVDQSVKLGWDSNEIDGDHVIEILTESAIDEPSASSTNQTLSRCTQTQEWRGLAQVQSNKTLTSP